MSTANPRIANIQRQVGADPDGFFGKNTAKKVLDLMGRSSKSDNLVTLVKSIQREVNIDPPTGYFGPVTLTRLEAYVLQRTVAIPPGASMVVSRKGLDMIVAYEVSSKDNYNKKLQSPTLPKGASGITIGIGYDLGYNSEEQIRTDWGNYLPAADLKLLLKASGLTGPAAQQVLGSMKALKIPFDTAMQVYYHTTVPRYAALTRKAFLGVEKLPPDAQAAILSLVFNRGPATKPSKPGDTRRLEMAAMVPLVKAGDLQGIAEQVRKMKRIWQGQPGVAGLLARRDREADRIENATFNILPEDQVLV